MANISKIKNKKTGEVYGLGPKTWEITLTEEQYDLFINGDEDGNKYISVEEVEGAADIEQYAKSGDFILIHTYEDGVYGDTVTLINTAFHVGEQNVIMTAPFLHSMGLMDIMIIGDGQITGYGVLS